MVSACCVYLLVPETLNFRVTAVVPSRPTTSDGNPPTIADASATHTWKTFARSKLVQVKNATSFLSSDWRILVLMPPFIVYTICAVNTTLLLQYTSKRYLLSFAQSNLLYSIYSGFVVVVFFVVIPLTSALLLQKTKITGQRKDLYLGRTSTLLMACGWTLVGLAPNVPSVVPALMIAAMGTGGANILRSFLASLVPAHHIGRTFSVLGIADTLGMMAGAPILARLYKAGFGFGGVWTGLPFMTCGMLMLCCSILLFVVGIRPEEDQRHLDAQRQAEGEEEDDDS